MGHFPDHTCFHYDNYHKDYLRVNPKIKLTVNLVPVNPVPGVESTRTDIMILPVDKVHEYNPPAGYTVKNMQIGPA